ncbi:MAG: fasciclin domain-containing protein [Actinomycetota bacterium]
MLLACVLVMAACGSDDDAEEASASASEEAEEETTTTVEETTTTTVEETTTTTAATEETEPEETGPTTVIDVATANGATFIPQFAPFGPEFAQAAGGEGPVTAFLTDDAWFGAAQTTDLGVALQADFTLLAEVLAYHVSLDGALTAEELAAAGTINTVQGEPITVELVDDVIVLNGGQASVVIPDVVADNGIAFIIDGVLVPPSIAPDFGL